MPQIHTQGLDCNHIWDKSTCSSFLGGLRSKGAVFHQLSDKTIDVLGTDQGHCHTGHRDDNTWERGQMRHSNGGDTSHFLGCWDFLTLLPFGESQAVLCADGPHFPMPPASLVA